jgi:hypothetical protein
MSVDAIGWVATAVFVSSYFFGGATAMRRMQIAGASLWMIYGLVLGSWPVVVANVLTLLAAALTAGRDRAATSTTAPVYGSGSIVGSER